MPISLYTGEESYLLSQAYRQLRQQLVDPNLGNLSHRVLQDPAIYEVLEAVNAVFFNLGGTTLIEIHEFEFLNKAASEPADEKQLEGLKTALEELDASKHVLFVSKKINRRIKFPKWLASQKFVEVREFQPLAWWKTDEAASLIMQEAKRQGTTLSPQAANALVEHFGVDLQILVNEVQKLSVYAAGRTITPQDVAALSNHDENTFEMLAEWVKGGQRAQVFKVLQELLLRQHPVALFALAETYVNNLFQLRYWQLLGYSQGQIAERTKKKPYAIQRSLEEFGRVPMERLQVLKEKTVELEWCAKSGQIDSRLALEMLLGT